MKRTLLFILFAFLIKQLSAQPFTFQKSFRFPGNVTCYATGALNTADGNRLVYGYGNGSSFFMKLTNAGDTLWTRSYSYSGSFDLPRAVIETGDGGFLATGTVSQVRARVYILRLDADGHVVWSKIVVSNLPFDACSVVSDLNGGFLISASHPGSALLKIDSTGQLMWAKRYITAVPERPNSLIRLPGGYVFVSTKDTSGVDHHVVRINNIGDTIWTRQLTLSTIAAANLRTACRTPDNGFLLGGSVTMSGTNQVALIKTDSSGNVQWNKYYGAGVGYDVRFEPRDTSYILSGLRDSTDTDMMFLKVRSLGNVRSMNYYSRSGNDLASFSCPVPGNGYLLGGYTLQPGSLMDVYLVQTDPFGFSGCQEGTETWTATNLNAISAAGGLIVQPDTLSLIDYAVVSGDPPTITSYCFNSVNEVSDSEDELSLFPNPVRGKLNIDYQREIHSIDIMNMEGRMLIHTSGMEKSLDVSSLSPGSYFVVVKGEKETIRKKIVISR